MRVNSNNSDSRKPIREWDFAQSYSGHVENENDAGTTAEIKQPLWYRWRTNRPINRKQRHDVHPRCFFSLILYFLFFFFSFLFFVNKYIATSYRALSMSMSDGKNVEGTLLSKRLNMFNLIAAGNFEKWKSLNDSDRRCSRYGRHCALHKRHCPEFSYVQ